jgi:hypothetical protein
MQGARRDVMARARGRMWSDQPQPAHDSGGRELRRRAALCVTRIAVAFPVRSMRPTGGFQALTAGVLSRWKKHERRRRDCICICILLWLLYVCGACAAGHGHGQAAAPPPLPPHVNDERRVAFHAAVLNSFCIQGLLVKSIRRTCDWLSPVLEQPASEVLYSLRPTVPYYSSFGFSSHNFN